MKPMKWKEMSRKRKRFVVLGAANILLFTVALIMSVRLIARPHLIDVSLIAFLAVILCVGVVNLKYLLFFEDDPDSKK